jgi:transcriptional regulator with XRE-family HTH domain
MSDVGQRLKAAREAAKLRQSDVQARFGWGATALSDYENGKYGISDDRLIQLATLYGVDPSVLAGKQMETARADAFYDGILHALAVFNRASGELIQEVQAWRESARAGGTGTATPPVSRAKLDATAQRQLAEDAATARRRRGTG